VLGPQDGWRCLSSPRSRPALRSVLPEGLAEGEAFRTKFDDVSIEIIITMIVDEKLREWNGLGV
jgi:hypothetical protein